MTIKEAIEMLTAKAECLRRDASGTDVDCNLRNCDDCDLCYKQGTTGDQGEALGVAISALATIDQFRWERDLAIEQLKGLGYELGEKPREDVTDTNVGDTISRTAAIDTVTEYENLLREIFGDETELAEIVKIVKHRIIALPSSQPEIIKCKDCKYYKAYDYTGYLACHYVIGGTVRRDLDDFCSRAERRIDG